VNRQGNAGDIERQRVPGEKAEGSMSRAPLVSTFYVAAPVGKVWDGFVSKEAKQHSQDADGWPRILSRLKTLLETGKTFRPH
jgi:hypothetical protein